MIDLAHVVEVLKWLTETGIVYNQNTGDGNKSRQSALAAHSQSLDAAKLTGARIAPCEWLQNLLPTRALDSV